MEISQTRQKRIWIAEEILRNEGNQINTQSYFKKLIMEKLNCREYMARKIIEDAINYGWVIPVTEVVRWGNSGGKGRSIYYILPINKKNGEKIKCTNT
jgi:hypothetical protein